MKLRARIERSDRHGVKSVKLTFPASFLATGKVLYVRERVIERSLGPRPWSEVSYRENGEAVQIYIK